jgi:membrane-associated phospholipid phosphatase
MTKQLKSFKIKSCSSQLASIRYCISILLAGLIINGNLYSQNRDIELLRDINLNRNVKLDGTFKIISTSIYPVSAIIPSGTILVGYIKNDSTILNRGLYIGASIATTFGITYALKYAINRERPYDTYSNVNNVVTEGSPSFPSGHSSDAFATATSLSLAFPKWYVIAPSYLWATGVAYSRMHLGVHYPSDVLVGCLIGTGTAYLCYEANKWLTKKRNN